MSRFFGSATWEDHSQEVAWRLQDVPKGSGSGCSRMVWCLKRVGLRNQLRRQMVQGIPRKLAESSRASR